MFHNQIRLHNTSCTCSSLFLWYTNLLTKSAYVSDPPTVVWTSNGKNVTQPSQFYIVYPTTNLHILNLNLHAEIYVGKIYFNKYICTVYKTMHIQYQDMSLVCLLLIFFVSVKSVCEDLLMLYLLANWI
jgi:hypothetical protein